MTAGAATFTAGAAYEKEKRIREAKDKKKWTLSLLMSNLIKLVQTCNRMLLWGAKGIGNLSAWQLLLGLLAGRILYPYLKPEMQRLLYMIQFKLRQMRDAFLNKIATKLTTATLGMAAVGTQLALNNSNDSGDGNGGIGRGAVAQ